MRKITLMIIYLFVNTIYSQKVADYDKLGSEMDQTGNYRGAIKIYEKALQLEPNNSEILEKLFFAKCNLSKDRSALDVISKLITLNPESSKFYFFRGSTHFKLKKYAEAISDYTQAINNQENKISNYAIYSERGLCKLRINDYNGALADFNQLLSVYHNPDILRYKNEAESQLKKQESKIQYRAIPVSVQHIYFHRK